jgi:hypothetical protein
MSSHNVNNSQCDLNLYGPDPGDGSVKCTCDEDAPIEAAVGPAKPMQETVFPRSAVRPGPDLTLQAVHGVVTLTGRAATTHGELREAGRELRAAQDLYRKAEARWKAALDAHMQELA